MDITEIQWTEDDICDVGSAELIVRTYIEHSDLRGYLAPLAVDGQLTSACDVGAGYGRMTLVLKEFCSRVVAFERERSLVAKAGYLLPAVEFRQITSLDSLSAQDGEFDFALSFTVLQHLPDKMARATLAEMIRIVRPGGYLLLCEETDDSHTEGQIVNPHIDFIGRSIETFKAWAAPFYLVRSSARAIERGYIRHDVGTYLLFRSPAHSSQPQ
jgi:SAM-dependent methyltransferase